MDFVGLSQLPLKRTTRRSKRLSKVRFWRPLVWTYSLFCRRDYHFQEIEPLFIWTFYGTQFWVFAVLSNLFWVKYLTIATHRRINDYLLVYVHKVWSLSQRREWSNSHCRSEKCKLNIPSRQLRWRLPRFLMTL